MRFKSSFWDSLIEYLPGVLAFLVFWLTMAPTLQAGDAGEQIAAAHFLGISHPTGTPLYLMLMKAWELLFPFGSVAWRMNLLNVILGSVTVLLFSRTIQSIALQGGNRWGSSVTLAASFSLVLACSETFWYESAAASSYVLHCLFVVAWFHLLARVLLREEVESLRWVYGITGLALSHHVLSLILLFLTLWCSVSLWFRGKLSLTKLVAMPLWVLPGLSLYAYIPLRAGTHPPVNWGTPDSIDRFLHYILRKDYFRETYVYHLTDLMELIIYHFRSFLREVGYGLAILVGTVMALRLRQRLKRRHEPSTGFPWAWQPGATDISPQILMPRFSGLILLGIAFFILNAVFLGLHGAHWDLFVYARYMAGGYVALLFSAGVFVATRFERQEHGTRWVLIPLLLLMPLICFTMHLERNDRSKNRFIMSYVDELFSQLPEGAVFYAMGDNHLFPVLYYHLVEGRGPGLTLFNPQVGLGDPKKAATLLSEERFFSSHYFPTGGEFALKPRGLVYQVTRRTGPPEKIEWRELTQEEIKKANAPLEKILLVDYYYRRSVYHHSHGEEKEKWGCLSKMESAAGGFDQSLMLAGVAFARMDMMAKAVTYLQEALRLNPKNRVARTYLEKVGASGKAQAGMGPGLTVDD